MTDASSPMNRRILVIDDTISIHEDFRKTLCPDPGSSQLHEARAALFGEAPTMPVQEHYELDFTTQGQNGLGLVHCAVQEHRPYAIAFVDMRMPPGWDGLETIDHLRSVDPDLQIVICTAYSDHSWEEISRRIGTSDNLLILMKPFNSVELTQLARSLTGKWWLAHQLTLQPPLQDETSAPSLPGSQLAPIARLRGTNGDFQHHLAQELDREPRAAADSDAASLCAKAQCLAILSHEMLGPLESLTQAAQHLSSDPLSDRLEPHMTTLQRSVKDLLMMLTDLHACLTGARGQSFARSLPHDMRIE